jgi:hypothetical protein
LVHREERAATNKRNGYDGTTTTTTKAPSTCTADASGAEAFAPSAAGILTPVRAVRVTLHYSVNPFHPPAPQGLASQTPPF